MPDPTENTVEQRSFGNEATQFKPGNPGRPKGARNKLGEAFLEAMQKDFEEHGASAIVATRETKPEVYVRVIAGLLPTEHKLTIQDQFADMTDDELRARIGQLAATISPFLDGGTGGADEAADRPQGKAIAPRVH